MPFICPLSIISTFPLNPILGCLVGGGGVLEARPAHQESCAVRTAVQFPVIPKRMGLCQVWILRVWEWFKSSTIDPWVGHLNFHWPCLIRFVSALASG